MEKIVQARTKEVHLILNNIGQGFLTVGLDGVMSNERSSIISKWFGECGAHTSFASYIKSFDDQAAEWFELGMESICEGFLPIEVTLEQLPKRIILGSSTLDLSYKPILDQNGTIENILIIISDITSEIEREASKQQQQLMDIFGHIMRDKLGFLEFLTDTDQMMDVVKKNKYEDIPHLKRIIHTIKGNAGLFGMTDIANLCHELEDEIVTKKDAPTLPKLKTLDQAWVHIRLQLDQLLGERMNKAIEINDADYEAVLRALLNREAPEKIARMMRSWKLETAQHRLEFIKKQAEGLALRMGKKGIQVITQANNIRFESEYWAPFWSNFIHVLRNAIDHGIENQDERSETNKTGKGSIYIETAVEKDQLLISVKDDGRGVNWRAIKEKAEKADLPHMNQDDLLEAIYKDGISTKNVVTHFSGRGVGMGAVRDICADLGGRMELKSEVGKGTRILFQFPLSDRVYNSVDDMPERAA
ncbi:MAG: ATP-binding protein [Nitrospiria bacterium]